MQCGSGNGGLKISDSDKGKYIAKLQETGIWKMCMSDIARLPIASS